MKIQLASDIHLEFPGAIMDIPNAGGTDVLILGGDICTGETVESKREFFERHAARFPHVIYLMGNHEHYHGDFQATKFHLLEALRGISNLYILEKNNIELDGVHFWAGTLWTDCNDGDPETIMELSRGMNDYRLVMNDGDIFSVGAGMNDHKAALASLGQFLDEHADDKVVVCTHHAPTKKSIHPRYKGDLVNGGYSSDLSVIMHVNPNIALWTHGHTHDSFDYMEHKTRVVCNPAGYQMRPGKVENPKFDPLKVMEI